VIEERVLHRSSCLVCHQPLNQDGQPAGIADPHPWFPLGCTQCHGGQDRLCDGGVITQGEDGEPTCSGTWVYDRARAHVSPGDGPAFIKNLSGDRLDAIDPAYLRFINPGDLRVVAETCARCHPGEVAAVTRSTMAHTSGEVTVARYRAMAQDTPHGMVAAVDVTDESAGQAGACAVPALARMDPLPIELSSADPAVAPSVANAQDQYLVKSCFRCHLNDFGENKFPGDFRSSGCTACHMPYADDGLTRGTDPWVNRQDAPHPVDHRLTRAPPITACTHCHYRGGRIGTSYQGYRESAGAGLNPPQPGVLGEALHGHDANYYLTDEDLANDWDETPPDLHFEAGMHCVDCHTKNDIHGDTHLYADTQCAVTTECEDCHGTVRAPATPVADRPNLFERDGKLWLRTAVTGLELEVPQAADVVTPGRPGYSAAAAQSMGVQAEGWSHTDKLECYTCHAGWAPSCYGCHVEIDLGQSTPYHTTGEVVPGRPVGERRWVVLNDLVLMWNTDGKLAPSMPAERFFMTLLTRPEGATESTPLYASRPREFELPDGRRIAGFGQRAFNPHTTRRKSQFMACDRCHSKGDPAAPDNQVLLDLTHGFGTQRFLQEACDVTNQDQSCDPATDWTTYALDAIQTPAGEPLVVVGHPDPLPSRPLTLEEVERMRQVIVPADPPLETAIPPGAATDPAWPRAIRFQDAVYPPTEKPR
jgi:hypothetical protein